MACNFLNNARLIHQENGAVNLNGILFPYGLGIYRIGIHD